MEVRTQEDKIDEIYRGGKQDPTPENLDLFKASEDGNVEALEKSLAMGANVNYMSRDHLEQGGMALHKAVRNPEKGIECVKLLLENGARKDVPLLSNLNTPLHEAASVGNEKACRLLLKEGMGTSLSTNIDKSNLYGNTPIFSACRSGSVNTFRLLMEHHQMNNINHLGSTLLHLCAFLCEETENCQRKTSSSERRASRLNAIEPPLQIAAMILASETFENIDCLDMNGHSPLHIASQRGCTQLVKLLVDSGASLTLRTSLDSKGRGHRTAADMASISEMMETHELILQLEQMKQRDESIIVTMKMAKDLEGGYSISNPVVGTAIRRRSSYSERRPEFESSFQCQLGEDMGPGSHQHGAT
jgi:ankyrin repeat protein